MKSSVCLITCLIGAIISNNAYSEDVELIVNINGSGIINISDNETQCTESCQVNVKENEQVTLTFENISGFQFSKWGDESCDAGSNVIISKDVSLLQSQSYRPKEIEIADFNGDGIEDIAAISLFSSELAISLSDANGGVDLSQTFSEHTYISSFAQYDWEDDGDIDLLLVDYASNQLSLYLNDGNGEFSINKQFQLQDATPYTLAINDIDEDGYPDILVSSFTANIAAPNLQGVVSSIQNTELKWLKNNGNDEFSLYQSIDTEAAFFALEVADMDNNGKLDIIGTATNLSQLMLYRNLGDTYQADNLFGDNYVYGLAVKDIDKNGQQDIVVTSYYGQALNVLTQYDELNFKTTFSHFAEDGLTAAGLLDVNNDGRHDIIWGEFDNRALNWVENSSYETCIVNTTSNRTIDAYFVQTTTDNVTPPPPKKKESSSGGGSTNIYFLLCCLILLFIRKPKLKI